MSPTSPDFDGCHESSDQVPVTTGNLGLAVFIASIASYYRHPPSQSTTIMGRNTSNSGKRLKVIFVDDIGFVDSTKLHTATSCRFHSLNRSPSKSSRENALAVASTEYKIGPI